MIFHKVGRQLLDYSIAEVRPSVFGCSRDPQESDPQKKGLQMHFLTKLLLAGVVAIGIGATVAPSQVAAQCTLKCECDAKGCGCKRKDGNGSSCSTDGYTCEVSVCQPTIAASLGRAIFARDGKALAPIAGIDADGRGGRRVDDRSVVGGPAVRHSGGSELCRSCRATLRFEG